ncbi:hypothetical protein JH314_01735 [Xanthomonas campestris]|uniref:hypothetical protein n=1 Tax=Xanthomonas campestris TaxID=339 RepID=UPI001300DDDD|nr:hypothetical protein [Xanthomonas campestris]MCC5048500.1 hypothetical protein [Xanthomonas campestris]MCC5055269.1 hypothetical protein [Xanthomonas campestris]MCC5060632.1 hypothetical protein [Xanthomonas campestris]MDO0789127.1 hypothetical protein [Xanthomonas campestris pv. campestris]MDO0838142.1 hypothetical protein [Xanthomonas campestris pv. campestris]
MQTIGLSRVRQADCVCGVRNCLAAYIDEQLRSLARATEAGMDSAYAIAVGVAGTAT